MKLLKYAKVVIALTVAASLFTSPAFSKQASAGLPTVSLKKVDDINFGQGTTKKGVRQYNSAVNKIVTNAKQRKSNLEKIYYVHNAIIERFSNARNTLPNIPTSRTAYKSVLKGDGNPQGIAHLNYHILKKLGIKSEVVLTKDKSYAWNKVKLGGKYYNVDVYRDGQYHNTINFENFMVSDKVFKQYDDSLVAVSKNTSKDTKYDYFNKASDAFKFTDTEIYYVYKDYKDNINQIRSISIKGKDRLIYEANLSGLGLIGWKGWVYHETPYTKKVNGVNKTRRKIFKVSYDGKKKIQIYDTDSYILGVGRKGIELIDPYNEGEEFIKID